MSQTSDVSTVPDIHVGEAFMRRGERTTDFIFSGTFETPWGQFREMLGLPDDDGYVSIYGPEPLVFLPNICKGISDAPESCNVLCGDAKTMFESWETTWNCLTLVAIWQAVNVSSDSSRREVAEHIENTMSEALEFNISAFDGMAAFNNVYQCAEASCRLDGSDCKYSLPSAEDFLDTEYFQDHSSLNSSFCEGVLAEANPDIAGPGIYLSLMFQGIMALYIWAITLISVSRRIIDAIASPLLYLRRQWNGKSSQRPHRFIDSHQRLHEFFTNLEQINFLRATNSLSAEFSEAQCFYTMVITIAVLYADSQGAAFQSATHFPSAILNQEEANFVSVFGFAPILLVQISLYLTSMDSFYSLVISTVAYILAGVAGTVTERLPTISRFRAMMMKDGGEEAYLEACGGNPSLRSLCKGSRKISSYAPGSGMVWVYCPMLIYLWCARFRHLLLRTSRALFLALMDCVDRRYGLAWAERLVALKKLTWFCGRIAGQAILMCACGYLLALMGFFIWICSNQVRSSYGDDSDRPWGLGQVISVLVWIPVLAKYAYTLAFGVQHGFNIRLPNIFSVQMNPTRTSFIESSDGVQLQDLQEAHAEEEGRDQLLSNSIGDDESFLPLRPRPTR